MVLWKLHIFALAISVTQKEWETNVMLVELISFSLTIRWTFILDSIVATRFMLNKPLVCSRKMVFVETDIFYTNLGPVFSNSFWVHKYTLSWSSVNCAETTYSIYGSEKHTSFYVSTIDRYAALGNVRRWHSFIVGVRWSWTLSKRCY